MKTLFRSSLLDDFFDPSLQQYTRTLFKELARIQLEQQSIPESVTSRYLTPLTFWQFSKLPKTVSDSLYKSFSGENGMSCGDLISCLSVFLEHNQEERTKLIFDLLDSNKDGTIDP